MRLIHWEVELNELYPVAFDDKYRFIKTMSALTTKSTALGERFAEIFIEREGFTGPFLVYRRSYVLAEETDVAANLQANEMTSFPGVEFFTPSTLIVGNGIILPPRSRVRASISGTASFNFTLEIIMIEADTAEAMSQFI